MAESHVISGLVSKRAEVAGQITSYQSEIHRLQSALSHLDGTIKLFAPEFDLRTVKSKRTNARNQYFEHGEAQRMTLDVLREVGRPMCSREIADALMQRKGIKSTAEFVVRIQKNILAVLHRLMANNIVKTIDAHGEPGVMHWEIV
ncbi:hypothetical protein [Undibacterium sp. Di24W]|uniref:hypothetical protein n=1 Tax=Undibacterium sp. Di24W TaxID=3413033 RepID=UPI003BF1CB6C